MKANKLNSSPVKGKCLCSKKEFLWLYVSALGDSFEESCFLLMVIMLWCFGNLQDKVCFGSS